MKVKSKYPYLFFPGDYPEMKPSLEDVFYEKNGQTFSQFFKGQLIPLIIWNELFGDKEEEVIVETKVETITNEKIIGEKQEVKIPELKVLEPKVHKKRRKSIIKK